MPLAGVPATSANRRCSPACTNIGQLSTAVPAPPDGRGALLGRLSGPRMVKMTWLESMSTNNALLYYNVLIFARLP